MANNDHTVKVDGKVELTATLQPSRGNIVAIASELITPRGFLFIGTGGNIAVIPADNPDAKDVDPTGYIVFKNIPDGTWFPMPVVRVGDVGNGTTATDLVFCM
jgi:hypothetical protein